jgi:hypothetical protein
MLLTTVVAIAFGWWSHHLQIRNREEAVIPRSRCFSSDEDEDSMWSDTSVYRGPGWLRRLLPESLSDVCRHATNNHLAIMPAEYSQTVGVPANFTAAAPQLKYLRELSVSCRKYVPWPLAVAIRFQPQDLDGLASLVRLDVQTFAIDHETVQQILQLPNLKALQIVNSLISDEELKALVASRRLELLRFAHCPAITDAGIRAVLTIPSLKLLEIEHCELLTKKLIDEFAKHSSLTVHHDLNNVDHSSDGNSALSPVRKLTR